ncbi:hypothetical protein L0337_22160 [candidate division KSB1 bacterium]|nr:hypothetical protein [candidate division KSB1 bacterium]
MRMLLNAYELRQRAWFFRSNSSRLLPKNKNEQLNLPLAKAWNGFQIKSNFTASDPVSNSYGNGGLQGILTSDEF